MSINQLSPNVFNMIAAGEVVERPSSVVKELIENAADAGASIIDVKIANGGTTLIQVSDNGVGIENDDLKIAFKPHATSKIKEYSDLDTLATLGFRGEALPSIASVSKVEIISKNQKDEFAKKLILDGGVVTEESQASRDYGTIITVRDLFYNTPARLKFLKKDTSEQRYIIEVIKNFALANPSIQVTLSNELGILVDQTPGELQDSLYTVYDSKTANELIEIKPYEANNIKVTGFCSKIENQKANRTYQYIMVNGRNIKNQQLTIAVEKAYENFIMKRNFPAFVLDIIMPFDQVDVNVHPSKTEVRFENPRAVFSAVYHAVLEAVQKDALGEKVNITSDYQPIQTEQERIDTSILFNKEQESEPFYQPIQYDNKYENKSREQQVQQIHHENEVSDTYKGIVNTGSFTYTNENSPIDINKIFSVEQSPVEPVDEYRTFDGKIIGQLFDTYILLERDGIFYIIDQHAAHERVLYDKIVKNLNKEYTQPLIVPIELNVSELEKEFLITNSQSLSNIGFIIKNENNRFYLTEVPAFFARYNISKLIRGLLDDITNIDGDNVDHLLKDRLSQLACKQAIKGGDSMTREQLEYVIDSFIDDNGNLPSRCPHGRPCVLKFTETELEKMFKRIV